MTLASWLFHHGSHGAWELALRDSTCKPTSLLMPPDPLDSAPTHARRGIVWLVVAHFAVGFIASAWANRDGGTTDLATGALSGLWFGQMSLLADPAKIAKYLASDQQARLRRRLVSVVKSLFAFYVWPSSPLCAFAVGISVCRFTRRLRRRTESYKRLTNDPAAPGRQHKHERNRREEGRAVPAGTTVAATAREDHGNPESREQSPGETGPAIEPRPSRLGGTPVIVCNRQRL